MQVFEKSELEYIFIECKSSKILIYLSLGWIFQWYRSSMLWAYDKDITTGQCHHHQTLQNEILNQGGPDAWELCWQLGLMEKTVWRKKKEWIIEIVYQYDYYTFCIVKPRSKSYHNQYSQVWQGGSLSTINWVSDRWHELSLFLNALDIKR